MHFRSRDRTSLSWERLNDRHGGLGHGKLLVVSERFPEFKY